MGIQASSPSSLTQPVTSPRRSKGWLSRLKMIQKIVLGYALSVSVAIAGTGIGIVVAQRYENEAFKGNEEAIKEILTITNIENSINRFIAYERRLIIWFDNPDEFLETYTLYQASGRDFQENWAALLAGYAKEIEAGVADSDEELALLNDLLKNYSDVNYSDLVEDNLNEVEQFVKELDVDQLQGQRLTAARQSFIELNRRSTILKLEDFEHKLAELADFIEDNELEETQKIVSTSAAIQLQVIGVSIVLSLILASLLSYGISRTINRPLKKLEEIALRVTQDEDFDLRADVESADEIGSLANSLNQLIDWIGNYTYALQITQQDLTSQAQELNAIIDNLGDGLLVIDPQGQITRVNPTLKKMFKLGETSLKRESVQTILNQEITDLIAKKRATPELRASANMEILDNRIGQAMVTAITPSQESIIATRSDQAEGFVILIRDVTAEKEIDQMKTDFISMVSHELRTPLTSVLGFAKLIQKKLENVVLPAVSINTKKAERAVRQVRENLQIIVSEGERLTLLINDVLDISKIEAGKTEWNMQPLAIADLIDHAISATSVLAHNNHLEIIRDIEPDLPVVMCDRNRLLQVLINLLSNAIKFTEQGAVTCRAQHLETQIKVSIIDTGIGISTDDLEIIFEKFKQVGEIMTDKPKGTGLGLPICKQIVEHHGGRIWAESQPGQGSIFSFTLPLSVSLMVRPSLSLPS